MYPGLRVKRPATRSAGENPPGGQFIITGHKIKIAGTDAGGDPVKVTGHLAENSPARLIGIIPALAAGQWKARVVTLFSSDGTLLKEPRTIESAHPLTVARPPGRCKPYNR
ncbi:MAG: DUF4469 domain-containing protein [Treponematales bacterium]